MRLKTSIKRASRVTFRHGRDLKRARFTSQEAASILSASFGPSIRQLPPSLRVELLSPHLQSYSQRSSLFSNLACVGRLLLDILVNDQLGTRTVELPPAVIQEFCDIRGIGRELGRENAPALLYKSIGAVNIFCGDAECREMVREQILGGTRGLASVFLDGLQRRK